MQLPNYTPISNSFIAMMGELTGEQVKVFIAISRKTIGWHKLSDKIPYSQLREMTGIKHHVTLKKALLGLVDKGLITMSGDDTVGYTYDLAMSPDDTVKSETVSRDDTPSMSRRDTSKETIQNKESKETNINTAAPVPGAEVDISIDSPTIIEKAKDKPKDELRARLYASMLKRAPDQRFTNYGKENKGVDRLVAQARMRQPDDPDAWLGRYLTAFKRRQLHDDLFRKQPFIPSVVSSTGLMERVLDDMAKAVAAESAPDLEIPW